MVLGAMLADGLLDTGREVIESEIKAYARKFLSDITPREVVMNTMSNIRLIVSILLILVLSVSSVWFGNTLMKEYFQFGTSIVFSWASGVTYTLPGVLSLPFAFFVLSLLKGQGAATISCSKYIRFYSYHLFMLVFLFVLFPLIYINHIENKGYMPCEGIPTGYMPGMGKQYVTDIALCK